MGKEFGRKPYMSKGYAKQMQGATDKAIYQQELQKHSEMKKPYEKDETYPEMENNYAPPGGLDFSLPKYTIPTINQAFPKNSYPPVSNTCHGVKLYPAKTTCDLGENVQIRFATGEHDYCDADFNPSFSREKHGWLTTVGDEDIKNSRVDGTAFGTRMITPKRDTLLYMAPDELEDGVSSRDVRISLKPSFKSIRHSPGYCDVATIRVGASEWVENWDGLENTPNHPWISGGLGTWAISNGILRCDFTGYSYYYIYPDPAIQYNGLKIKVIDAYVPSDEVNWWSIAVAAGTNYYAIAESYHHGVYEYIGIDDGTTWHPCGNNALNRIIITTNTNAVGYYEIDLLKIKQ